MLRHRQRPHAFQWLMLLLAFVSILSHAQPLPKGVTQGPSVEGITEYRLPNGLKVLLFPDQSKPTITINVTYLVGSRFENYGETGMAHLLEHLMFKGTPKHPSISVDFNKRGMRSNASTWADYTNYHEIFEATEDNLRWALDMEADRMVHSNIAKKDLDSEMTVVRNEFENGENSPGNVLGKRVQNIAFDWHNYGHPTIGNRSDIENVKIANLQAFYRMYYQPDNAVLLVAGKFDAAKTLKQIANVFGAIPKPKRTLPVFWTAEPTQDGERSVVVRRKGDSQIVMVAYKMPSALHPDSDALDFAGEILADTPSGRLYKSLVETGKATSVFQYTLNTRDPGLFFIGARLKNGEPVEPVRDALLDAVENFYKTPPTREEMERTKRDFENLYDKLSSDPEQLALSLSQSIALGDWRLYFYSRDAVKNMTAERVSDAAGRYLRRGDRTVGIFQPEDQPQRAVIPEAPSARELLKDFKPKTEISAAEAFDPSQKNINARTRLEQVGGVSLALLPKKNRGETVSVALTLHLGNERTLFGKQMVSRMTDAMLARGNSKFNRQQLADEFERLKISGGLYHFDTTREHLVDALKLVAQVLKEPTFPASEFEQLKKQMLVGVESGRSQPDTLAFQAIGQHFNRYPVGDPRRPLTSDEQIAAINAVTLDDVKAFHKQLYGATKAELAIVGDFDADVAVKTVADALGSWKSAVPYSRIPEQYFDIPAAHLNIDTPDKENGFYTARLNLDMRDDDPDFPALLVANYLFGEGGLDSRLINRIRQKDGLSYSADSGLDIDPIDHASTFSIAAIAAPQNLARVDADVREELTRAAKEGFTAEELAKAKSGLLQQRLQARAQDSLLAGGWARLLYLGRTYEWSKQLDDNIRALTVEQVNAAFRKWIDPSKMTTVIAGDASKMKPEAK